MKRDDNAATGKRAEPMLFAQVADDAGAGMEPATQQPGEKRRAIAHPQEKDAALRAGIADRAPASLAAAHLAAIVASAEDAIASKTLDGIVTSWNASAERMFGYSAEEMIGQPILRLIPTDRHDEEDVILARIRAGQRIEHFETARLTKDGRFLDVSLTISPIRDGAGTIIGASKIVRDITERKHVDQLLAEQNHLLELVATGCPMDECLADLTRAVARLEPHTRALVLLMDEARAALAAVVATDVPASFGDGLRDAPISELTIGTRGNAVFTGKPVGCADIAHDDGWSPQWRALCVAHGIAACYSQPVIGSHGVPLASLILCFETPRAPTAWELRIAEFGAHVASMAIERARVEETLRVSAAELEVELAGMTRLHQISSQLIHEGDLTALHHQILDGATAVMRSDIGSMQMFYPERNELRLLAWKGFASAAAAFWEWVRTDSDCSCGMALTTCERVIIPDVEACDAMADTQDLEYYHLSGIVAVQSTPLISRDGHLVGMISTHWRTQHQPSEHDLHLLDLLARQAADLIERTQAEEALRAANQRKDEFLSIASHELRTPLTSAKANVQIVSRRLARALEAPAADSGAALAKLHPLQRLLEHSEGALDRLNRLMTDLLDDSRIQAGKLILRPRRVDLTALVRDAVEEESEGWPGREVRLEGLFSVEEARAGRARDRSVWAEVDPDRVREVVYNYLSNACKYAPPDRPITVRMDIEGTGDAAKTRIAVRDHGPGLTSEQREHLFERFYRVEGIAHQHGSALGLGLGLYICRTIVERHNGQVGVESVPGVGSTFWFTLPLEGSPAYTDADEVNESATTGDHAG